MWWDSERSREKKERGGKKKEKVWRKKESKNVGDSKKEGGTQNFPSS